ncbi:MAG TPA: hypothetical protein PKC28_00935 [Bdellovibrionales bacterium]|nr:hypothetical protein [Bdellovibrionales bacterium]
MRYYVHSPIGDPLTAAMLGHSRKSLSHWNTIQLSLASYKSDLLLALGVIGVLMEMDADAWPRKERSVLNSKVKDLFADDDIDPAGYNYHFYGHLNMTLQGFGAMLRTTSAFEEADDPGDHAADLLGVDTGEYVLKNLNGPTPKCELP